MTPATTHASAPTLVRRANGVTRTLLRLGLPMGPNVILTVRGRTSGQPRSAPVAVVEIDGRRWIIGAYGDVHWVRNLRAAGEGDIELHGRTEHVTATALDHDQAVVFYGEVLAGYIRRLPWFGRAFARVLFRAVGPEVLDDPERAAATRPVFELHGQPGTSDGPRVYRGRGMKDAVNRPHTARSGRPDARRSPAHRMHHDKLGAATARLGR